jgi:signal transduction histidine kinase
MRLLPRSIAGRFLTLLFASIFILHLGSIGLYHLALKAELDITNDRRLAERLASVKRAIAREALDRREELAHALSGGPLEIHWSEGKSPPTRTGISADTSPLKEKLIAAAPELAENDIAIAAATPLPDHASATRFLLVSMQLDDGSWVEVTATRNIEPRTGFMQIALSTTMMVLGVLAVAAFFIRQLTRSLRSLADAANGLDPNAGASPIEEIGPSEVKALSIAFNDMQRRVRRLVDDRTQTLAAISHDLKTPITRMRLRSEEISDHELVRAIAADLTDMEAMLDSTLAFLRGDQLAEEKKPIDLGSLLETITTDLTDLGHDVTLVATAPVVVRGRHLALKRAFWNLTENAVKYGGRARVTLQPKSGSAVVSIDDDGPGIPEDENEAVLRPFYRIDNSRNRETGGVGLGLTVAHSIIKSHDGELALSNRNDGGLSVTVILPV